MPILIFNRILDLLNTQQLLQPCHYSILSENKYWRNATDWTSSTAITIAKILGIQHLALIVNNQYSSWIWCWIFQILFDNLILTEVNAVSVKCRIPIVVSVIWFAVKYQGYGFTRLQFWKSFCNFKVVLGDPWELRTKQWHQSQMLKMQYMTVCL